MRVHRFPLFVGLRAFRLLAITPAWFLFIAALSLTFYLVGPHLPYGNTLRLGGYVGLLLALCMCVSLEMVRPVWTEQGILVLARESTTSGVKTMLWRVVPR